MKAIIIAGGSGSRLWPISTPAYPKHLLSIGDNKKSLLQRTYERAKILTNEVFVMTEASHANQVKKQMPGIANEQLLIEPTRKGTANCIVYALSSIGNITSNEPIIILWADHHIRDTEGFAQNIERAANAVKKNKKIALIGIEPSYPATGFGYIKKRSSKSSDELIYEVDSFKEKPNYKTAQEYIKSGHYLWNSGYLVFTKDIIVNEMKNYAPDLYDTYEMLQIQRNVTGKNEKYRALTSKNIDNSLIEKIPELIVVPAIFDWLDLGSYADLHKAVDSNEKGNAINGNNIYTEQVENAYIHSQEEKPVVVIGLDNIVVINTKDGILVARKDLSQAVGDVSKRIIEKENE